MLCVQNNIERNNLTLFSALLERLVNGSADYKTIIDKILLETRELINEEKNLYSIDRDNFEIILFLQQNASDIIKVKSSFNKEDYKEIIKMLNQNQMCLQ